jgi:hypothetical protein
MISTEEVPDRNGRVLRIALIGSLLVHLIVGLIYIATTDELARLLNRVAIHQPKPKPDEVVTVALSSALQISKKARPAPAHAARPHVVVSRPQPRVRPRPPVPQHVAVVPRPLVQPKPVVKPEPAVTPHPIVTPRVVPTPKPEAAPTRAEPIPSAFEKELAKFDRHAPAQVVAAAPRPNPVLQSQPNPETPTQPQTQPESQPQPPSHASTYSQEQINQIESDLSKSIAQQSRVDERVLSDTSHAVHPSAPKRYAFNMAGIDASARYGAQGVCEPIKTWQSDGYNYYYLTCTVARDDGTVHYRVPVPWPVRYRPSADPLDPYDSRVKYDTPVGVPGPMPGWNPPPSSMIDPDIRHWLKTLGYNV